MDQRTKICVICSTKKQLTEFSKNSGTVDGRASYCRACDSQRHKERRLRNLEKHKDGPSVAEKRCPRCKTIRDASEFPHNPTTHTGLASYCLDCSREYAQKRASLSHVRERSRQSQKEARANDPERFFGYALKKNYNITVEDYKQMMEAQGGVCAICGGPNPDGRRLHVDHDHECCGERGRSCGKCVRGLLCTRCNQGLGSFMDSPEVLRNAIAYLG